MTDDIFLAQILGHKLLGSNAALSVGQSYKDFLCRGRLKRRQNNGTGLSKTNASAGNASLWVYFSTVAVGATGSRNTGATSACCLHNSYHEDKRSMVVEAIAILEKASS
jgi:hypothetical protein